MSRVAAHGLSIDPPHGWEVRIYRRTGDDPETKREDVGSSGTSNPILHMSTVPLSSGRGDYGSGVVEAMDDLDLFVGLLEFDGDAASMPLFAHSPVPRQVVASDLTPNALQRVVAGQAGAQYFAQEAGRAFCLYVVTGSHSMREMASRRVTAALATLEIEGRATGAQSRAAGRLP